METLCTHARAEKFRGVREDLNRPSLHSRVVAEGRGGGKDWGFFSEERRAPALPRRRPRISPCVGSSWATGPDRVVRTGAPLRPLRRALRECAGPLEGPEVLGAHIQAAPLPSAGLRRGLKRADEAEFSAPFDRALPLHLKTPASLAPRLVSSRRTHRGAGRAMTVVKAPDEGQVIHLPSAGTTGPHVLGPRGGYSGARDPRGC